MTTLRALVGACFLLAVMGIVVSVPLGWALLLGIGEANPEKIIQGRPYQRKAELLQKKILPRAADEGITSKLVATQKLSPLRRTYPLQRHRLPGHASDLVRATRRVGDSTRRG
jgi:hypothetical protein